MMNIINYESQYFDSKNFIYKNKLEKYISFKIISGGITSTEKGCSHRGYHGFMGIEEYLTDLINNWIADKKILG